MRKKNDNETQPSWIADYLRHEMYKKKCSPKSNI